MAPRYGLTPLQLFKYRTTFLRDVANITKYGGTNAKGGDVWTPLPNQPTPCFLIESSGFTVTPEGIGQAYTSKLILGGEIPLQDRSIRYQIKVDKVARDLDTQGNQVITATYLFEVVTVDSMRDTVGGEGLQLVKVRSA